MNQVLPTALAASRRRTSARPPNAGTTEITNNYDRVNALHAAFTAGCHSALSYGTLTSPAAEDTYAADIERRYGKGTTLYRACLKAWLSGYNTTYRVTQ